MTLQSLSDAPQDQESTVSKGDTEQPPGNYNELDVVEIKTPGLKRERGYLPIEFVQMNLPYSRTFIDSDASVETEWIRRNGNDCMTVTARRFNTVDGRSDKFIPYGKHARAILLYLMTQVKLTKSPEIELGTSFRSFMEKVGIPYSGQTARSAMNQLLALLHCTFDFSVIDKSQASFLRLSNTSYGVSDEYDLWFDVSNDSIGNTSPLPSRVKISQKMFESIMSTRTRPVDLNKYAELSTGKSAFVLDIYVWLSTKVYTQIKKQAGPVRVTWEQLHEQFGSRAKITQFKRDFLKELDAVLKVEKQAWVYVSAPGTPGVTQRTGYKGLIIGHKDTESIPNPGVMGYGKDGACAPPLENSSKPRKKRKTAEVEATPPPSYEEGPAPF